MLNFKNYKPLKAIAIGAIVTLSSVMMPVTAHAINDKVTFKISASDLTTQAGIERIYNKLEREAERACNVTGKISNTQRIFEKTCKIKIMDEFVESVDHKTLTAFHVSMKPNPQPRK